MASGKLLRMNADGSAREVFASTGGRALGFAFDATGHLVAETGRYRVWEIPVTGSGLDLASGTTGQARVLLDNLPGYPDNLMRARLACDAAATYAEKAPFLMESPIARYHPAAARYQKLLSRASTPDAASLRPAVAQVAASSRVSLEDAIAFRGFSPVIASRLTDLHGRSLN